MARFLCDDRHRIRRDRRRVLHRRHARLGGEGAQDWPARVSSRRRPVHLGSVLVGSAILTVPTLTALSLAILLGNRRLSGRRLRVVVRHTHLVDEARSRPTRACYVVLPILAYGAIAAAALLERWAVHSALQPSPFPSFVIRLSACATPGTWRLSHRAQPGGVTENRWLHGRPEPHFSPGTTIS